MRGPLFCLAQMRRCEDPSPRLSPDYEGEECGACMANMVSTISASPSDAIVGAVLFYICAAFTLLGAVGVVVLRNVVRMAVCLLFTLIGVAGLYFLLSAEFLAAVQLVVYAGGTLILIVFGVMLTSRSPFSRFEAKRHEQILAGVVSAILLVSLIIGFARSYFPENIAPASAKPMQSLGTALLGDFLIPFELSSVLLLAVMIGAAYLAKARRSGTNE